MNTRVRVWLVSAAAVVHVALAPVRLLSPDECYYLLAARKSLPWTIVDHPPLLGVLLRLADLLPGPVELKVRVVSVLLSVVTSAGIASFARRLGRAEGFDTTHIRDVSNMAWLLSTFGLLPWIGGWITTPDAPLLAGLSWLLAFLAGTRPNIGEQAERILLRLFGIFLLSGLCVLAKVSAVVLIVPISLTLFWFRNTPASLRRLPEGLALLAGVGLAMVLAWPSFVLQAKHALGQGPLVSAPQVGAFSAAFGLILGQVLLWSPPVLEAAWAAREAGRPVPGMGLALGVLSAALIASALVSGRPPEPNWAAPAGIVLFALAAVHLNKAEMTRKRKQVLVWSSIPTLLLVVVWIVPIRLPFTERTPHQQHRGDLRFMETARDVPEYGRRAWRCIYASKCE